MHRLYFDLERPKRIPSRGRLLPDYKSSDIELVGEGVYSALMLDELFRQGVNVTSYAVKDLPQRTKIEMPADIGSVRFMRTFTTQRGLARVIGNADKVVIFNLGLLVPDSVIEELGINLWNIHPSRIPEYQGDADPVNAMVLEGRTYGHVTIHRVASGRDKGDILDHIGFRFKPSPRGKEYSPRLVSEIYRDSVIPKAVELLKKILADESRTRL